jgi:hypothetical protein
VHERLRSPVHLVIGELAHSCGFSSNSVLSAAFRQRYGMSPREFRAQYLLDARDTTVGNGAGKPTKLSSESGSSTSGPRLPRVPLSAVAGESPERPPSSKAQRLRRRVGAA